MNAQRWGTSLHIAPPSSSLKKHSPRSKEAQSRREYAINARRRGIQLLSAHKLTRGGQTALQGWLDRGYPGQHHLSATRRRKLLLQAQGSEASKYNKRKENLGPTRTRAIFATLVMKRVTWARIVQMVTLINPTLSIMIFISLGNIKMPLVL